MTNSESTAASLTARTVADSDIIALRDDAGRAGDFEQVHICNRALSPRWAWSLRRGHQCGPRLLKFDARRQAVSGVVTAAVGGACVSCANRVARVTSQGHRF